MNVSLILIALVGAGLFETRRIVDDFAKVDGAASIYVKEYWYWMLSLSSIFFVSILAGLLATSNFDSKIFPLLFENPSVVEAIRAIIFGYLTVPLLRRKESSSPKAFNFDDTGRKIVKFYWWLNR